MTEKRFRYVEANGVDEHIIDCSTEPHFEYYTLKGATDKLNELNDENQFIKHAINEALSAERTELGKSVLKQLKQQIEVR